MENDINMLNNSRPVYGTLYFLGSGASASSGAPTFTNFYDKALDISKKLKDDVTYQEVLDQWRSGFSDYNIEEYFSAIEMREMITLNNDNDSTITFVKTQALTNFIAKTIEKSLNEIKSEDYMKFIQLISPESNDAIVTTNWDILLETEIPSKLENGGFNYISVTNYDSIEENNLSKIPIKLFKLHGSLNWAQCQGCHKVYYFGEKVYSYFLDDPALVPICNSCDKENQKLLPIIVPPTFSKLKNNVFKANIEDWKHGNFLNNIWNKAFNQIACSKEIYFIGYSFPQTDAQMRIFVSMALRANKSLEKIVVVSNEKFGQERVNFEENYRPIIERCGSKPKIEFNYDGFNGFCEKIHKENSQRAQENYTINKMLGKTQEYRFR